MRTKALFLSPAGALLTIVSFFLPWAKVSCAPVVNKTVSGASLGGMLWLVLPLAAVVLASFFYFLRRRSAGRSRPFVAVASAAALAIITAKCVSLSQGAQSGFSGVASGMVGLRVEMGGAGTLLGLALALAGALIGRGRHQSKEPG